MIGLAPVILPHTSSGREERGKPMLPRGFPGRDSSVARRVELAVLDAFREDSLGYGTAVDAALAAELGRIDGGGRPLPGWLADELGGRLDRDFGRVRLHSGDGVDEWTARFGTVAFCLGSGIFLDRCLLRGSTPTFTLEVLCHELAHVANAFEPGKIRRWEGDGHATLTGEAFEEFNDEFEELVKIPTLHVDRNSLKQRLMIACNNMDYRHRIPTPDHPLETIRYVFGPFGPSWINYIPITALIKLPLLLIDSIHPFFALGEGPRHGEGLNYTDPGKDHRDGGNIDLNLKQQWEEVAQAVSEFQEDKEDDDDVVPTIVTDEHQFLHGIVIGEKEWVKSLANALHTTQDRAAHREGRKGFGHDDPRARNHLRVGKKVWIPDDPEIDDHTPHGGEDGRSWWICNKAAFDKGFNNSCEVFEAFFRNINIGPFHKWKARSTIHLENPGLFGWEDVTPWWPGGCVHGRPPNPLGRR
jgi:hypothetical protein